MFASGSAADLYLIACEASSGVFSVLKNLMQSLLCPAVMVHDVGHYVVMVTSVSLCVLSA